MYHVRCEIVRCILKIEKIIFPYNYNFTLLQFWGFTASLEVGGGSVVGCFLSLSLLLDCGQ